jgi:serine/threonine protein kinase
MAPREDQPFSYLKHKFRFLSEAGFDLLNRMLAYNPEWRITAREALHHRYFDEKPYSLSRDMMPRFRAPWWRRADEDGDYKKRKHSHYEG